MKPSLRAKLESLARRLEELNRLLSAEDATRDMGEFKKLSREHVETTARVELYGRYRQAERDAAVVRVDEVLGVDREARSDALGERRVRLEQQVVGGQHAIPRATLKRPPSAASIVSRGVAGWRAHHAR